MREPEVVVSLSDVIGEFVAERKPDTNRRAGIINEVDADDFCLFAAVERECRAG